MQVGYRVRATYCSRQEEEGFLSIRRQVQEVHDLRCAGPRHVAEAGEVGVVADRLTRIASETCGSRLLAPPRARRPRMR